MVKFTIKYQLISLVLLIIAATVPYINTLSNEFVFDDHMLIVDNDEIRDPFNLVKYLQRPRGIKFITHIIEYNIWGLNPLPYHFTNLFLHLICTISLYYLLSMLFLNYRIPLISGLLFATHPVHTEAVAAISNRNEMLAMFFFIWSFIFYILKNKSVSFYLFSLVFFILALFSKEGAVVTLPVILILYDTHFNKANRTDLMKNKWYYIPYGFIIIMFLVLLKFILLIHPDSTDPIIADLFLHLSFPTFLYIASKAFLVYLKLLFVPVNLNVEHILALSTSFLDWKVLLSLLSIILFIFLTIYMYRVSKAISFGMTWFFITLLPLMNLIYPLTPYIVAERYLYLPSVGFCLVIAIVINKIMETDRSFFLLIKPINIAMLLLTVILFLYSGLTIKRNLDWRSDYTLWTKTLKQSPQSSRVHSGLGYAFRNMGKFEEAAIHYEEALKNVTLSKRMKTSILNNLGNCYLKIGLVDQAISVYKEAIMMFPKNYNAVHNLATAYKSKGYTSEQSITLIKSESFKD